MHEEAGGIRGMIFAKHQKPCTPLVRFVFPFNARCHSKQCSSAEVHTPVSWVLIIALVDFPSIASEYDVERGRCRASVCAIIPTVDRLYDGACTRACKTPCSTRTAGKYLACLETKQYIVW